MKIEKSGRNSKQFIIYIEIFTILYYSKERGVTMEKRDLYDKHKENTQFKILKEQEIPPNYYTLVVLALIQNSKNEILVQKRSKPKGGEYGLTSGHPKSGENSLNGIITEIKEELGVDALPQDLKLMYSTRDDINRCFYDLYYLKKDYKEENMLLQKEEVDKVYWFSEEKINELCNNGEFKESHIEAFKILMKKINGKY